MYFSSLILLPCAFALPLLSSDSKAVKREEGGCTDGAWACDASTSAFSVCANGAQMPVGTLPEGVSCSIIFPQGGSSSTPEKRQDAQAEYGQCAGEGYSGPTACSNGWSCQYQNPWYSQCLPGGGSGGGGGGGGEGGGEGGGSGGGQGGEGGEGGGEGGGQGGGEGGSGGGEGGGEGGSGGGGGGGGVAQHWEQCAGEGWSGPTSCAEGFSCQYQNPWYSQCL